MALKRVPKHNITNYDGLMTQFKERKIMMRLGLNPHTTVLHATFESSAHFNFLMEYCPGGEMFCHLNKEETKLTASQIRTYFCEILLGMEFLHRKKILYRDLKVLRGLFSPRTSWLMGTDTSGSVTSA